MYNVSVCDYLDYVDNFGYVDDGFAIVEDYNGN